MCSTSMKPFLWANVWLVLHAAALVPHAPLVRSPQLARQRVTAPHMTGESASERLARKKAELGSLFGQGKAGEESDEESNGSGVKFPSASELGSLFRRGKAGEESDEESAGSGVTFPSISELGSLFRREENPEEEDPDKALARERDVEVISTGLSELLQTRGKLTAAQLELLVNPKRIVSLLRDGIEEAKEEPKKDVRAARALLVQEKLDLAEQAMREAKMFALSSEPSQQRVAEQKKRGARLLAKEAQRELDRLLADAPEPDAPEPAESDYGDDSILGMVKGVLDTYGDLAAARAEKARVEAERNVGR